MYWKSKDTADGSVGLMAKSELVKLVMEDGNCIVVEDFNAHVRSSIDGYERVHGGESEIKMEKDFWSYLTALIW